MTDWELANTMVEQWMQHATLEDIQNFVYDRMVDEVLQNLAQDVGGSDDRR